MENTYSTSTNRLFPLDVLRGFIIVLMALDHANHFVAQQHSSGEYWSGTLPNYASTWAFFARFVTHLAAPGFFFLMGTGMTLFMLSSRRKKWRKLAFLRHFWLRGLILIGLQLLLVNRAWELSAGGWQVNIYIGVLFALGATMMIGSLWLWLSVRWLLGISVICVVGTAVLFPTSTPLYQSRPLINGLLLLPGGDQILWINYPIIPWLGLVTLGMAYGHRLHKNAQKAYSRAWQFGFVCLSAFVALRLFNGFGNFQPRIGNDWVAFLNVTKYPPSLVFLLLTMGLNLSLLAAFSHIGTRGQRLLQPLLVYGRVPLFFYITHLFLYAVLGNWLAPNGTSLLTMVVYWLLGLLILYPFCLNYGRFKQDRSSHSLWRLF